MPDVGIDRPYAFLLLCGASVLREWNSSNSSFVPFLSSLTSPGISPSPHYDTAGNHIRPYIPDTTLTPAPGLYFSFARFPSTPPMPGNPP